MRLRDRVMILRLPEAAPDAVDAHGNPLAPDWAAAGRRTLPAAVQLLSSDENTDAGQVVTTRARLLLYPRADVRPTDRVQWRGTTYEATGGIERPQARVREHHVEVPLTAVAG